METYRTYAVIKPEKRSRIRNAAYLHVTIMKMFGKADNPREEFNILYCVHRDDEGNSTVTIQSSVPPNEEKVRGVFEEVYTVRYTDMTNIVENGNQVNVSIKLSTGVSKNIRARRITNNRRIVIRAETDDIVQHWTNKVAPFATVDKVRIAARGKLRGRKTAYGDLITQPYAVIESTLTITDKDAFAEALRNGIGRGKAYGLGLLIVKRVATRMSYQPSRKGNRKPHFTNDSKSKHFSGRMRKKYKLPGNGMKEVQ